MCDRRRASVAVDLELACIRAIYTYGNDSTTVNAATQVEMRTYAHRAHMHLLITEFSVQMQGHRQQTEFEDLVNLQFVDEFEPTLANDGTGAPDVDLQRVPAASIDVATRNTLHSETQMEMECFNGSTWTHAQKKGQIDPVVVSLCRTRPPTAAVAISDGQTYTFTSAVYTSSDPQVLSGGRSSPLQAAQSAWAAASSLGSAALFLSHRQAQENLWQGRIEVADNHALVS